jgi:deoxyribodipyrimidine photolyase-related protein
VAKSSKKLASRQPTGTVRDLVLILGDQLSRDYETIRDLDHERDAVLMIEAREESTRTPSSKQRTTMFLAAMRHFALDLVGRGARVRYVLLDDEDNAGTFAGEIERAARELKPKRLRVVHPGAWRVLREIEDAADKADLELDVVEDTHFLCTIDEFMAWREDRKTMVLEHFYRRMRKKHDVLMTKDGNPVGGEWNFDKQNRKAFKRAPRAPRPYSPETDDVVDEVVDLIERELPDLPGRLDGFHWPVTREKALRALDRFIEDRLPTFGTYQDAMWTGENTLFHSLISPAINLKLLDPREVIKKAVAALDTNGGDAPINSVEGFVRQVLGWREFIRGVYWTEGEEYESRNGLRAQGDLPECYWTAETDMRCMRESIEPVLESGHSHHIQRLMVTGNFGMLAGVHPDEMDAWYLGMYVDAVEWVTIPNTRGMSQHADHGVVGTKPYASTGNYIKKMSNYCEHCRYDPGVKTGEDACPFTTLYWDFLIRNEKRFADNTRMNLMMKHVENLSKSERVELTTSAKKTRARLGVIKSAR